jgi:tellurite resistance protein TehA-like permease
VRTGSTWHAAAVSAARPLNPGYFAVVMATGIVSVGMENHGLLGLSYVLLGIGVAAYLVLVTLTLARIIWFRDALRADLRDPARAFGYFTFVAGTEVLGTRFTLADQRGIGYALLIVGGVSWLVLGYLVPWTAALSIATRPVVAAANGSWFIWVVASESVAVLAAVLEPASHTARHGLALLAVFSWSVGVFLYAATGLLVTARLLLYPLNEIELNPPYWVAMGATAITVLAGARIVDMADAPMVAVTRGLIAGASVVFWAFRTWLIPALVAAGWWRHRVRRVPLRYDASLWSIVFPLGMYGVAGHYIGRADRLPIVKAIGENETWVALAAWAALFVVMIAHIVQSFPGIRQATPEPEQVQPM